MLIYLWIVHDGFHTTTTNQVWPTNVKILIMWLIIEKACQSLYKTHTNCTYALLPLLYLSSYSLLNKLLCFSFPLPTLALLCINCTPLLFHPQTYYGIAQLHSLSHANSSMYDVFYSFLLCFSSMSILSLGKASVLNRRDSFSHFSNLARKSSTHWTFQWYFYTIIPPCMSITFYLVESIPLLYIIL